MNRRDMKEKREIGASAGQVGQNNQSPVSFIFKYFIEGIFALLPLTLTIIVIVWLTRLLTEQFGPETSIGKYLVKLGIPLASDSLIAYFLGWLIVFSVIVLLGFVVDIGARKYIKRSIDIIMKRIPLINKFYDISVKIVDMVDKNGREDFKGMSVVYCTFGGVKGALFLALQPTPQVYTIKGVDYYVILIPSAPVPVGGSLMLVPVESVQTAGISIDEFSKVYLSMGASGADILPTREMSNNN